jgi:peptide/nickel transport system permease protein
VSSAAPAAAWGRLRDLRPGTWLRTLAGSLRYGRTRAGLALTAFVLLLAFVGPLAAPHAPDAFVGIPAQKPSAGFPLGTDYLGHDVLSRVLWGGRSVVWMAFAAATIGVVLGAAVGILAAYSRSGLDDVLMRGMDVVLAFPQIVFVLLFVSLLGTKLWLIVLLVAITWVPQVARVARGITSEVVHREYVEAAELIGLPRRRILAREILPNVTTPLTVEYGLRLTWSIALIAAISFLGFGIQPPSADWGLMINENRSIINVQPWALVAPAVCIALFAIGTNLVAEGIARSIAGVDRRGQAR